MQAIDIHAYSLEKSTLLSGFHNMKAIPPREVISVLNSAGVSFVLIGAYGIGGWMKKPRATEDVDVIVAAKHQKKALQALLKAFPHLDALDQGAVTRLRDRETRDVAIDVLKPNQQLFRDAFKHTKTITAGGQTYRIPSLEMALAMKFGPMVSPHRRDPDKLQDAHDFIYIVESNPDIDLKKLAQLGDLVYPEGGKELIEKVRQVKAGEKLRL